LPKLYLLENKPKLLISNKVYEQIKLLCSEIPDVEWSGVLFHSSKGFIDRPESFELKAEYILPMDKGTSGYTSYEFNEDYINAITEKPELLNYSISHVHSHNLMSVFFSGTDNEELQENAPNYDYYLSLIVNNKMEMTARVAFMGKIKPKEFIFKGKNGKMKKILSSEEEVVFYYNMDIEVLYSEEIDEFFVNQVNRIQTTNKPVLSKKNVNNTKINLSTLSKDTNAINFIKFLLRKYFKKFINCKEVDTLYAHLAEIESHYSKNWKFIEKCEEDLSNDFTFSYKYNMIYSEYLQKGLTFNDRKSDLISMCEEGYKILTESTQYSNFSVVPTITGCFESVFEDFIETDFERQYSMRM
jgi:hypothetical protein